MVNMSIFSAKRAGTSGLRVSLVRLDIIHNFVLVSTVLSID